MAIVYQNGTVVSVPETLLLNRVHRSAKPVAKCFGLSFRTKMKIKDAAHVQHLELSGAMRFCDPDTGEVFNPGINHVLLTPTFDQKDHDSYLGDSSNHAIKRFTDNLTKRYGATSYLWVKEFTRLDKDRKGNWNGLVPHYHMMVTMPHVPIGQLNRAWSHARGDSKTVPNALRTWWNRKENKPVMRVTNYRAATDYISKYIAKSEGGDICVLRSSCKVSDRKTWEYREGHSTKCYGLSQNLHREPRQLDIWAEFTLKPWLTRHCRVAKTDHCDLFFFDDYQYANTIYADAAKFSQCRPKKVAEIVPKRSNYSFFDQTSIDFSQSIR